MTYRLRVGLLRGGETIHEHEALLTWSREAGAAGGEHAFVHALPPLPPGPHMLRASLLDAAVLEKQKQNASTAGAADEDALLAAAARRLAPRPGAGACAGPRVRGAGAGPTGDPLRHSAGGGGLADKAGARQAAHAGPAGGGAGEL